MRGRPGSRTFPGFNRRKAAGGGRQHDAPDRGAIPRHGEKAMKARQNPKAWGLGRGRGGDAGGRSGERADIAGADPQAGAARAHLHPCGLERRLPDAHQPAERQLVQPVLGNPQRHRLRVGTAVLLQQLPGRAHRLAGVRLHLFARLQDSAREHSPGREMERRRGLRRRGCRLHADHADRERQRRQGSTQGAGSDQPGSASRGGEQAHGAHRADAAGPALRLSALDQLLRARSHVGPGAHLEGRPGQGRVHLL